MAIGIVPGHEGEESNLGLHLHYVKGLGEHNHFGIGLSLETILDEHQHNSMSLLGLYHFDNGFTIAYAPGILFSDLSSFTPLLVKLSLLNISNLNSCAIILSFQIFKHWT